MQLVNAVAVRTAILQRLDARAVEVERQRLVTLGVGMRRDRDLELQRRRCRDLDLELSGDLLVAFVPLLMTDGQRYA
jgi:hypothetical protein